MSLKKLLVTEQMRVDQMKILDIYEELAQTDDNMKRFLVLLASRLNTVLLELNKESK